MSILASSLNTLSALGGTIAETELGIIFVAASTIRVLFECSHIRQSVLTASVNAEQEPSRCSGLSHSSSTLQIQDFYFVRPI